LHSRKVRKFLKKKRKKRKKEKKRKGIGNLSRLVTAIDAGVDRDAIFVYGVGSALSPWD